jgi:hypothetical protein
MHDEATFYRKVYEYEDMINRTDPGKYDLATTHEAMNMLREGASGYFKGLASNMDLASKQSTLSDAISERSDKTIRNISQWVNQLLMFDAQGNALTGDLFAERTPIRLEMERAAAALAMQGMSEGQIRANLIFKHRDAMGGLNLDIKSTPYAGSLTLMEAPPEFQAAVNRFFDLNESLNEDNMVPMWDRVENVGRAIDITNPNNSLVIYRPIPTPENPSVIQGQGKQASPFPAGTTNSSAVVTAQKQKKQAKPKEPDKPKEPEVPIEDLMARSPSSLTGPETARVMKNMTGPDFIRWMSGGKK